MNPHRPTKSIDPTTTMAGPVNLQNQWSPPEYPQVRRPALYVNTTAKQFKSPTVFPKFRGLSGELRNMVWEYAAKGLDQRIFHAKVGSSLRRFNISFWNYPKPPAVLHVCRDSRAVAKNYFSFIFNDENGNGTWWSPEVDILYFDSDFVTQWSMAKHNLLNRGYNFSIQRIAIDWRLCLTTLTPRESTRPGHQSQDNDVVFTALIGRFLKDFPRVRSLYIIYPEKQLPHLLYPSEPVIVKNVPIAGITDITHEGVLLGDAISRLRECAHKLSCPVFRGRCFKGMCRDKSWLDRILTDDVLEFEIRQFAMHREWPAGYNTWGMTLNSHLPRAGRHGWPSRVPRKAR
ncbi:hypothetical protein VMCG_07136 [Cytospora schulzeri]|uniref:2EXR domain-containing protein n=1 Tax=Cytospora schulzeri TaxID=448051 RepID=A0A423W4W0_9PEZI|nr:hypothetical protein VMCG_07136 [Valsa malicola]